MGVCYRLLRDDTRESFDLGKGPWNAVFFREVVHGRRFRLAEVGDANVLASRIANEWPGLADYAARVAARIVAWCGDADVWLESDAACDPDGEFYKYRVTADRYEPSCVKGYRG